MPVTSLRRAASVDDYRELARRRLPKIFFEYIDGGSYAEVTLKRNVDDLANLALRQRVMRDMSALDTSIETLGRRYRMPVGLSPVGMAGMYGRRGEVQAARAAASAGVPFCLSTMGICGVEEVASTGVPPWFQLYILKDRGYMRELLGRAKAAGSPVLVLTVDLPVPGARYRDVRSGFRGLTGLRAFLNQAQDGLTHPRWLWDVWVNGRPHSLGSVTGALTSGGGAGDFLTWIANNFDRSITWADLDWIRQEWDGPIALKGVMSEADARRAADEGVDAVIVSNHGGRQLDHAPATLEVLPGIADAVGDRVEVLFDSGIRRGSDIVTALALGARAVLIGRAHLYGLAAAGEAGVRHAIDILAGEVRTTMALCGAATLADLDRSLVRAARPARLPEPPE